MRNRTSQEWKRNPNWRVNRIPCELTQKASRHAYVVRICVLAACLYGVVISDFHPNSFAWPAIVLVILGAGYLRRKILTNIFGEAALRLDPYPASIGGHAGGELLLKTPYRPQDRFIVSITCLNQTSRARHNVNGERETRASYRLVWEHDGLGISSAVNGGTQVEFCFRLPTDAPESSLYVNGAGIVWFIEVHCRKKGFDFHRRYAIPVYDTGCVLSQKLTDDTVANIQTRELTVAGVKKWCEFNLDKCNGELIFPPFRRISLGVVILIVSLITLIFSAMQSSSAVMIGGLLIGAISLGVSVYHLFVKTIIQINKSILVIKRFLINFPIWDQTIRRGAIEKFEVCGRRRFLVGRTVCGWYSVVVVKRNGETVPLIQNAKNRREAEFIIEKIMSVGMQGCE